MTDKNKKPKIVDLFCGPGGLSLGFESAGFNIEFANDIDKHAIETFRFNHPNVPSEHIVLGDIVEFLKLKKDELKKSTADVVIGGPPCQGFSMANRQRLIDDPRNILYKKFVEVVGMVKPTFLVMENVKGMLSHADEVVDDFEKKGYFTKYTVLNAKDFGIPQNRERLVYIGVRIDKFKDAESTVKDIFKSIEKQKTSEVAPLKSVFWGLRKLSARTQKGNANLESKESGFTEDVPVGKNKPNKYILRINHGKTPKKIWNHKARYNNERDLEIFRLLPPGEKSDHESIAHIMPYKNRADIFKDKFFKLLPDKPSKTITSHMKFDCHMYIHPNEVRGITPREAARIQSFPDSYVFKGPYTQWYSQIGNAVPPLLGEVIAKSIKKKLLQ